MRIQRARQKDYTELVALWQRSAAQAHRFLSEQRLCSERAALMRLYLPKCEVWIARSATTLGFIALRGNAEVAGLFVDPAAQGQGVGRALLDHVRGPEALSLEVAAPNFKARLFYQHYGFREVSRRHDPELDEELLRMQLETQTERSKHE